MIIDPLERMSRGERRNILAKEEKLRRSGKWGQWTITQMPNGLPGGSGWNLEFRKAYHNAIFCVFERPLPDGAKHLMVSSLSGTRPSWWEMQRLKNEIAGEEATAIEIYPPQLEVMDGANAYHIWVLPGRSVYSLRKANLE